MATKYGSQVWGNVNISGEIVIDSTNNTLSFDVDGVNYILTLDEGKYKGNKDHFTSELIEQVNTQITASGAQVFARFGGLHLDIYEIVLVFEHLDQNNPHTIDNFSGTALDSVYGLTRFSYESKVV